MVAHSGAALRSDRLRVLNRPTRVLLELDDRGLPAMIVESDAPASSRRAIMPSTTRHRRVADIIEAWRIDDEWWREPISRQYFDVVLEEGAHVVVFQDLITGEWFLQQP